MLKSFYYSKNIGLQSAKGISFIIRNDKTADQLLRNYFGEKEDLKDKKDVEIHKENRREVEKPQKKYAKDNKGLGTKQIKTCANKENESPISVDYNNILTSVKDIQTTKCVPYEMIKELFNKCYTSSSKVTMLTERRKTMLQSLWYDMGQAGEPTLIGGCKRKNLWRF